MVRRRKKNTYNSLNRETKGVSGQQSETRSRSVHLHTSENSREIAPSTSRPHGSRERRRDKHTNPIVDQTSLDQLSTIRHIPGFYYDTEKKKYFKVLDSTHNRTIPVVTKEKIAKDTAETKRAQDVSDLLHTSQSRTTHDPGLYYVIAKRERGDINKIWLKHHMLTSGVTSLKPSGSCTLFPDAIGTQEKLEHMQIIDSNQGKDKLLALWSLKDTVLQRMQLLAVSEKPRQEADPVLSINISTSSSTILQSWISKVCWAPFSKSPDRNNVLYTTMSHSGHCQTVAYIRNLNNTRVMDDCVDFNLGSRTTWSCSWNRPKHQFSIGTEKKALLIDVETRRMWEISCNSDPFVQTFSCNGDYLYNGGRSGAITCHDLRVPRPRYISYNFHTRSIAALKIVHRGLGFISSDITGKMCFWDTRMRRPVFEYSGLVNKYSRIPMHVEESGQIVYGVGQDCYTRFWNIKSGELLKSIPPPIPASIGTIPVVQYSTRWGNRYGNAGLVMGLEDQLYYYSHVV